MAAKILIRPIVIRLRFHAQGALAAAQAEAAAREAAHQEALDAAQDQLEHFQEVCGTSFGFASKLADQPSPAFLSPFRRRAGPAGALPKGPLLPICRSPLAFHAGYSSIRTRRSTSRKSAPFYCPLTPFYTFVMLHFACPSEPTDQLEGFQEAFTHRHGWLTRVIDDLHHRHQTRHLNAAGSGVADLIMTSAVLRHTTETHNRYNKL